MAGGTTMLSRSPTVDVAHCAYNPVTNFDHPHLLSLLYGDQFDPHKQGSGQIIVLGQHNSGTSIVTRLLMLLGAFQGNYETISISPKNRLKYYEQLPVSMFHDAFLQKFTDPRFRPYHGQNVSFASMTAEDRKLFDCFATKQIKDMNRHPPWVMKDPRMANVMHLWRPHLDNPICVFVYKEPASNSMSLASNRKKSSPRDKIRLMTSQRWLDAWSGSMERSLEACRGTPTIIMNSATMVTDVMGSLKYLRAIMTKAGVTGLHMPSYNEVSYKIRRHIRTGTRVYKLRHDLGFNKNSIIDNTMPVMSSRQKHLDGALRHWMQKIADAPQDVDLHSVAENVQAMMQSLQREESIRRLSYNGLIDQMS